MTKRARGPAFETRQPIDAVARTQIFGGEKQATPANLQDIMNCARKFQTAGISGKDLARRVASSFNSSYGWIEKYLLDEGMITSEEIKPESSRGKRMKK